MTDQEIEDVIEGGGQGQDQGALTGTAETLVVGETDTEEETGDERVRLFVQPMTKVAWQTDGELTVG